MQYPPPRGQDGPPRGSNEESIMETRLGPMRPDDAAREKNRVEDALRRHGIEGEEAFNLVAFLYVRQLKRRLDEPPASVVQRGRRALRRVTKDSHVVTLLTGAVERDPAGDNLPIWYQHFVGRRFREGSGKFFTPRSVARAMAALLPRTDEAVIMDPTCGGGTFLLEASRRWAALRCHLVGNDVEASLVDLAKIVLSLGASADHGKVFIRTNIFEPDSRFQQWYGRVDYILANPPFSLQIEDVDIDSPLFHLGYRNSDALFLDICLRLLRPGGRLVCLLPHSIVANSEFEKLRRAVERTWDLLGVIGMPEGVFHLTASTTTRADIVILQKRGPGPRPPSEAVFAFAPSVGVPLNSRARGNHANHLETVVTDPRVARALRLR